MLEKGKINPGEFQIIVAAFTIGSAILVAPAPMSLNAKQDAWLAAILTLLISLFFVFVFNRVTTLYPSMTYVEYSEKILGKGLGKIAVFPFLFYTYQITCGQVRDLGDFLTTEILAETPIQMIMIIFTITGLIGVRAGLEVICRSAVIFFPWILTLISLLFLFLIPQIKFENLQPIMANGLKPILRGSYPSLGNPLQLGILFMIMPYVTNKTEMKKAFYWGYFIGGLLLTILITMSTLVLGADLTARQSYPSYMLGKKIQIGTFLQRIEVIVAITWMLTLYFKMTICYYGLSLGLAQVFGLKSYKIVTLPLAFLIVAYAIFMNPNIASLHQYLMKTLPPFSLTICLIFPLLLFAIGKIKMKLSASKVSKP